MLHEPAVRLDDALQKCVLLEDLVVTTRGYTLVIPAGFATDLASTPRASWGLGFAPWELGGMVPCIPHDWGYEHGGHMTIRTPEGDVPHVFTKDDIDLFFLDLMEQQGVPLWKREAAYAAVRECGASSWQPWHPDSPSLSSRTA